MDINDQWPKHQPVDQVPESSNHSIYHQLKRLAKGTVVYGLGQVLNRFLSFLLLPVFTSYLSPKEYGISAILTMLSGLLACVFSLGIGVATGVHYYIKGGIQHRSNAIWMGTFVLALSAFSLLSVGVGGLELLSMAVLGSTQYEYLVFLTLITTSLGILAQPSMLYLQFEEKATQFVAISITTSLVTLGNSVLFVVILERGLKGLVESGVISQFVLFLVFFSVMFRHLRPSYNFSLAKKLLRTGYPYIFGSMSLFLVLYADRYILEIFRGLEDVGIYSVGYSIGMMLILFVSAFSSAWMPYFNSFVKKQEEAGQIFGHVLNYYVMGMGLLCLCMFLFAKPVVILMTAESFHKASAVVGLIATAQMIYGCHLIFLPGLYYARKIVKVNFVIVAACGINILLNLVFIPIWGMLGAAASTVISFFVMSSLMNFIARKYLMIFFDWSRIFRYATFWGGAVAVSYFIQGSTLTKQILLGLLVLACFLYVTYLQLNEREKDFLRKIYRDFRGLQKLTRKKC